MTYNPARANPLFGNPLTTRAELQQAVRDLYAPLLPYVSDGGARVRLSAAGAHFDRAAADLEGFARPLWGIVPLVAGGGSFAHWDSFRRGLANGCDPEHPEYWGDVRNIDQRQVELAAIGLALRMVPQHLWEPLDAKAQANVIAYLTAARERDFADNNWKFFRVLIDLGLIACGAPPDPQKREDYLDELEAFYLGQGWYRDGPVKRIDHYTPFAIHFYGLIYAELAGDAPRAERYRDRARAFAPDIRHWFGDDGAALPFGRSLTYRFACGGFWGALAFAGVEALPWGEIKGYYMRHLRWWADKPIADRDGVLSIGYGYPNLMMSESYNSAGSPYWAMKVFLPLALPADHPFWQAEELPAPVFDAPHPQPAPGMVAMHQPGNTTILSAGQEHSRMRGAAEKYSKFVYSTRYGFSIEGDDRNFNSAGFDGTLGLSDDGIHLRMRETSVEARIAGTALYTRWRPYSDVEVETWLIPEGLWHYRYHQITTPRNLFANEGGFAVAKADFGDDRHEVRGSGALVRTATDVSAIVDLIGNRTARVHSPTANTNLIHAKTLVPQLQVELPAGETLLACAVMATKSAGGLATISLPAARFSLDELKATFDGQGQTVGVVNLL